MVGCFQCDFEILRHLHANGVFLWQVLKAVKKIQELAGSGEGQLISAEHRRAGIHAVALRNQFVQMGNEVLRAVVQRFHLLPVMAVRDSVVFPLVIVPLTVGREPSVKALDEAMGGDGLVLLLSQKNPQQENPGPDDLYGIGCVAQVLRMLKAPDGTVRVLVQGLSRAQVDFFRRTEPHLEARLTRIEEPGSEIPEADSAALVRAIRQGLERISSLGRTISPEILLVASTLADPLRLADLAASNLGLDLADALAPRGRRRIVIYRQYQQPRAT